MIKMGQLVKFGEYNECAYVTYPYACGNILSVIGQGKRGSFPILTTEVNEAIDQESILSKFHGNESMLWVDKLGKKIYITVPAEWELNGEIIAKGPNIYFMYRVIITDNKVEYLDRTEVAFCYQLDNLVLIQRSLKGFTDEDLLDYLQNFHLEDNLLMWDHSFWGTDSVSEEDIYFGTEKYYTI